MTRKQIERQYRKGDQMDLSTIAEEYQQIRHFKAALQTEKAELAIVDEEGYTPLSKVFQDEEITGTVVKALALYQMELMRQIREALNRDEQELLHHKDLPEFEREEIKEG